MPNPLPSILLSIPDDILALITPYLNNEELIAFISTCHRLWKFGNSEHHNNPWYARLKTFELDPAKNNAQSFYTTFKQHPEHRKLQYRYPAYLSNWFASTSVKEQARFNDFVCALIQGQELFEKNLVSFKRIKLLLACPEVFIYVQKMLQVFAELNQQGLLIQEFAHQFLDWMIQQKNSQTELLKVCFLFEEISRFKQFYAENISLVSGEEKLAFKAACINLLLLSLEDKGFWLKGLDDILNNIAKVTGRGVRCIEVYKKIKMHCQTAIIDYENVRVKFELINLVLTKVQFEGASFDYVINKICVLVDRVSLMNQRVVRSIKTIFSCGYIEVLHLEKLVTFFRSELQHDMRLDLLHNAILFLQSQPQVAMMKSFNLMFDEALFSVLPAFIGLVNVNGLIRRTSPFLAIFIEKFWLGRIFMQTAYQNFLSPTIFNKYIDAEFNGVASAKNIVQFLSVSDDRLQMFMNYWGGQDLCQAEYVFSVMSVLDDYINVDEFDAFLASQDKLAFVKCLLQQHADAWLRSFFPDDQVYLAAFTAIDKLKQLMQSHLFLVTLLPHPGIRNTMLSIIAQGSLEEWSALLSTIFTSLQHSISSTVEFIMLRLQQLNRDGFFPLTLTITDVIRIYQATDGKQPDGATNLHQWRQMLLTAQAKLQSLSLGYDPDILCRLYLPASTGREFFIHCNKVTVFIEDVIALQQQTPLFVEDQFTQLLELVHRHGLVIGQAFVKQIRDWQEENLLEVENEFSISYLLKLTRQLLQQNSTNEKIIIFQEFVGNMNDNCHRPGR